MLNIKKVKNTAEKLNQIRFTVRDYINENMNSEFKLNMVRESRTVAKFRTTEGLKVKFEYYNDYDKLYNDHFDRYEYIDVEGQIGNKPFELHFCASASDKGSGTVFSGKYGIAFWNIVDYEKKSIIKPFIKNGDRKVYMFANKAIDEILPLIEEVSKDIETMTMEEETIAYLNALKEEREEEEKIRNAKLELKQLFFASLKNNDGVPEGDRPHTLRLLLRK